MIQHVNTVLVGTAIPASYSTNDSLNVGEVALFDENKKVITSEALAADASSIYVGVCEEKETVYDIEGSPITKSVIRYSAPIQKNSNLIKTLSTYIAPSEDVIVITATSAIIEIGHRYVLRLIYRDIYESPNQAAQVYEIIASTTSASDLMAEFARLINKNKGTRVTATVSGAVLTLTAKEIPYVDDDYELYSQVDVDAFMWKTIPSGILSNVTYSITNLTIAKTKGTPGKGNPKIIRDRERAAFGYRGITYRANGMWPYIAPEAKADLSKTYDSLTLQWDNKYLSNDNQYVKNTLLSTELYVEAGKIADSLFIKLLYAFSVGLANDIVRTIKVLANGTTTSIANAILTIGSTQYNTGIDGSFELVNSAAISGSVSANNYNDNTFNFDAITADTVSNIYLTPQATITFDVKDGSAAAIAGATITINNQTLTTNASGIATILLKVGTYSYTAVNGEHQTTGSVTVTTANATVNVTISA